MTLSRRSFLQIGGATAVAGAIAGAGAPALTWGQPLSPVRQAAIPQHIHLLNRITWGVTEHDRALIETLGYDGYLDQQLNPEQIDNRLAEGMVRPYTTIMGLTPDQLAGIDGGDDRMVQALVTAVPLRGLYSRHQLLERMVEFWSDHFNATGEEIYSVMGPYYNETIRENALGNFRSLVIATAKSAAMLVYLDNFVNVAEHPNENYARELLELHTLGVDGGYTEDDVVNVARAFTGWTVNEAIPGHFFFNASQHDTNPKTLLGRSLPANRGIEDGLHVIDIVTRHPATAQFISRKLCVYFVSDNPPQSLVDSTAAVFMANNGEIKPVLRHILTSSEFKASAGQKLRRPLGFYIAALRAVEARVMMPEESYEHMNRLGQVPYGWLPPNGYPAVAGPWMTTNGLIARWNVAQHLTEGAHGGDEGAIRVRLHELVGNPATVGDLVTNTSVQVFGYRLPDAELAPFVRYASDDGGAATPLTPALKSRKLGTLFGLMLASPMFQWH